MLVRYSKPTEDFPFYSNVKVKTSKGWKTVMAYPTDGRSKGPAIFASKEEMVAGVKRAVRV